MGITENAERNIRQALADYWAHTAEAFRVYDSISGSFIERLARDSTRAKRELRELFSKSPAWDEKLDALVINGTRTHDPDLQLVHKLAFQILDPAFSRTGGETRETFYQAVDFFANPGYETGRSIEAIKSLAPKAYAPNKKPSRIFRAMCDALQVSCYDAGSAFQQLYAQFADELTAKKIGFKLYVSINPAHFLTMSNPKEDSRGSTLTSCHSLNSTEYEYNVGCTGYARDRWSFIAFTASDPQKPETLNNRKTTRQIFAYKPGNGLLLQSRLYNTGGGTQGAQEDSALYRDLIQRELSDLEGAPNLWKTYFFLGGKESCVYTGTGFGGYADWTYENFDGKVSIRADREASSYESLTVGTYGLCVSCAEEIDSGLYCTDCAPGGVFCDCCENSVPETHEVYGRDGNEERVCGSCRDEYYCCCDRCGDYFHRDIISEIDNDYICEVCREAAYECCAECGDYHFEDDMYEVYDSDGCKVYVCSNCRDEHYDECAHCGGYVHHDSIVRAYDVDSNCIVICNDCRDKHFAECDSCGDIFDEDAMDYGLCPTCQDGAENVMEAVM